MRDAEEGQPIAGVIHDWRKKLQYRGTFFHGQVDGFGEVITKSSRYEGEISNGMRQGLGTLVKLKGRMKKYTGMWYENERHGFGKQQFYGEYGSYYVGNFF